MSTKVKKAIEKQRAAAAAAEADKLRQQMIEDMHEEIRLEKYNSEQEAILEERQMEMRQIQLRDTQTVIYHNTKAFQNYILDNLEEENWIRYMKCDGLPNPEVPSEMNTYMFIWSMENENADMGIVTQQSEIMIYLLSKLDEFMERISDQSEIYVKECKVINKQFRNLLQERLDMACYRLLRQIDRDMTRVDMKSASYIHVSSQIICCFWAFTKFPISIKVIPEKSRKAIEVTFKEIELTVKLPLDVDCHCIAIRGLWTKYDHISDTGITYSISKVPEEYEATADLLTYCQNLYDTKQRIREEQVEERKLRLEEKKAILEKLEHPPPPAKPEKKKKGKKPVKVKKVEPEPTPQPLPYLPTPDEIILAREEEIRKALRKYLSVRCDKTEVNLRKYKILGGIYHIDLFHLPPQPREIAEKSFLTNLQLPLELKRVAFSKEYTPPAPVPDNERTPEVIEEEMKALESAMEKLALVTLKLPDTVLWFEPPLVAHWIPERCIWSTQYVHDIKYNEEQQVIAFRTGRLGIHGLAANKFINLPFQSWELKPETGKSGRECGGVVLNVTGAAVQAEFVDDLVALNSLVGGTSSALQDVIGAFMNVHHLVEMMRNGGCDLFPERDAICYVKGLAVKHPTVEKHLRECMGLLCTAYSFSWSRWNATRPPREIVVQCRELRGCVAKERSNITLLITPSRVVEVQCSEVSQEFTEQPVDCENAKFYADLYHYALHNAGIKTRMTMSNISFKLALTVTKLLQYTNVISMSS